MGDVSKERTRLMDQVQSVFEVFDLFLGFGSLAAAGFFFFLYRLARDRQVSFQNATPHEGVIIEIIGRQRPVIEYEFGGKTIQFRSSLNAPGAKVGQRVDLELSTSGTARIKSSGHAVITTGLLLTSLAFALTGCYFLIERLA